MAQSNSTSADDSEDVHHVMPRDAVVEDTDAGGLVFRQDYEYRPHLRKEIPVGRELIGFAGIDDPEAMRDELAERGWGAGALHQLPDFGPSRLKRRR